MDAIKELIAEGAFAPGDKFHSENELCRMLQVSRSSIREAVRILEVTGQVTVRQGKGIFLVDTEASQFRAFSDWLRNNQQSIFDHFEVRLIIEPRTAYKAAQQADAEDIARMERACREFARNAEKGDTSLTIQCDREFHKNLARSTKNNTLYFLMKSMTTSLADGWISSLHAPGRIQKTISEHEEILRAVRERDAERAMNAMTRHLENAINDIKSSMA